jgi:hypothetical protein
MEIFKFVFVFKEVRQFQVPVVTFRFKLYSSSEALLVPRPNSKLEDHPLSAVARLLIQCIRGYPPCLEAVSSSYNPVTRPAMLTGIHITWNCLS